MSPHPSAPGAQPEYSRTNTEESFVIEFQMFMTLVARVARLGAERNKRFCGNQQFDEMLNNIGDARNHIVDREIIIWLIDLLGIYRRRYGLGADLDIGYIRVEIANFNQTLLASSENYVSFSTEQMFAAAESVTEEGADEDTVNQAKNIKDSIEMMLNEVKKLPVGKQLVRWLRGKQNKKKENCWGDHTILQRNAQICRG